MKKPVVLLIMDGWGHRDSSDFNAPRLASTPIIDGLDLHAPKSFLAASGAAVGLPVGQVGNSEVGHMTIGAGRIIKQDLARIDDCVADGSISDLAPLHDFAARLQATGGTAHLMGLVSAGGVHSRDEHILSLAKSLTAKGVPVAVHAFTDGRDTLPRIAAATLPDFVAKLPSGAFLATVSGRYYAMDRDNRWDRVMLAYRAIAFADSPLLAADALSAVEGGYDAGLSDEFILPTVISGYQGMAAGDAILMGNFRSDRARQILSLFADKMPPEAPPTQALPKLQRGLGLVSYSTDLDACFDCLFSKPRLDNFLGDVVSDAGFRQLRLAETEKYPHVTFFLNGGQESVLPNEDRTLIPSPKVATYDLQPEMSASGVLARLLESITNNEHDLIIVNFANPDMVGHTGDLAAAIKAAEVVDTAVGEASAAVLSSGGIMFVTADHGNCEIMWDAASHCPHTAHSSNPVPLYLVGGAPNAALMDGGLADLAPTILTCLGLPIPPEMSGHNLLRIKL